MIKRIYDKFNSRCYIRVKCDFCVSQITEIDGYGIKSKDFFKELDGWKQFKDGKVMCASCCDSVTT